MIHYLTIKHVALKGILRQNIEYFLKKSIYTNLGIPEITEKCIFFLIFPTVCIFAKI